MCRDELSWDSGLRRTVTVYIPLALFVIVLLSFYWMTITAFKPDYEMYDYKQYHAILGVHSPRCTTSRSCCTNKLPAMVDDHHGNRGWLNVSVGGVERVGGLCDREVALQGRAAFGLAIYLAYLVPPSILFIPLATLIFQFGLFDNPIALILTYPTFLVPFCTWLLIGYFKSIRTNSRNAR